ncbi:MAG: aminoglycoside phosphotransferase family protein [Nitrospirae bacterium]|nr:aminoglycoside phosphotransferase family protein [Nitrospirota bacterium]
MNNLADIAEQFKPSGRVVGIDEHGSGNINKTYLVTLASGEINHFILQRINTQVFRQPEHVMQNMQVVTEHMRMSLRRVPPDAGRRWKIPHVLLTHDGKDHFVDGDGAYWRAISFIEDAQAFDTIKDAGHAEEAGRALGMFHNLLSDLPTERLIDTLPGFHITPLYLRDYDEAPAKHSERKSVEANYCVQFVKERSGWAHVLENAKAKGILRLRTIHGDPKINNIMMDIRSGLAAGIIDLDTVKPGLVHYDIGDCLRSCCNPMGEETEKWEAVYFDTVICRAVLRGYLSAAREFLTESDFDYMYDSVRLITFELGLRFFTDYLKGDVYFRVRYPEHNLARALVQFKLVESIESQERAIRGIIRDLR